MPSAIWAAVFREGIMRTDSKWVLKNGEVER